MSPCERASLLKGSEPDLPIKYTRLLDPVTVVKNQCGPTCALETTIGMFEQMLLERTGKTVELSSDFLIARWLRDRTLRSIANKKLEFPPGASLLDVLKLVERHGLMPKSAWQPILPLQSYFDALEKLVEKYRDKAANGVKWDARLALGTPEVRELYRKFMMGAPKDFNFEGSRISPRQLVKLLMPNTMLLHRVMAPGLYKVLEMPRTRDLVSENRKYAAEAKRLHSHILPQYEKAELGLSVVQDDSLDEIIKNAIDQDLNVGIAIQWNTAFVDESQGIATMATSPGTEFPTPVSQRDRWHYIRTPLHEMRAVGYKLDGAGKIEWLRIRNSYGKENGNQGEYDVHRSYLYYYLEEIEVLEPKPDLG